MRFRMWRTAFSSAPLDSWRSLAGCLAGGALVLSGCAQPNSGQGDGDSQQAQAKASASGAGPFVRQARQAHELANRARSASAKSAAARELLSAAQTGRKLTGQAAASAHMDLVARAAQLHLELKQPERAGQVIQEALAQYPQPTVMRAQLLLVLAKVQKQQGLEEQWRTTLVDALEVNQFLLDQELKTP